MQLIVNIIIYICAILTCINAIKANHFPNTTAAPPNDHKVWFQSNAAADVMKPPNPPTITSLSRTSQSSTYFLTWTSTTNLTDVQFYVIRYRKELTSGWEYETEPAASSSVQLTDLESSSLYEVEVVQVLRNKTISKPAVSSFRTGRAKTSSANKPRFNSTSFRPNFHLQPQTNKNSGKANAKSSNKTAKVPGAPSKPTVIDTSTTSVSLTWRLGSNGGSPITGYKIQTRKLGSRKKSWKTRHGIISADTRTLAITGLERGTSYKFRVIAINNVGESQPSQSTDPHKTDHRRRLVTAPEITIVQLMQNGSLLIHWKYEGVAPSSFNGFILKLTVDKKRRSTRIRNSSITSYLVKTPIHDIQYTVKIQGYDSNNNSPKSHPTKFKIIRDHAKKEDRIDFINGKDPTRVRLDDSYEHEDGPISTSPYVPVHNEEAKALGSRRDLAILIAGLVVVAVVFILAATAVLYHRRALKAKQDSRKGSDQSKTNKPMNLSSKLGVFCCGSSSESTESRQQISSTSPHCSCCSGNSSPQRIGGSCLQSNRTSMSHSIVPENGAVQCSRVPNNPMYTVYYDYRAGRPPPCCSPPGIPLWWVRGADGEFCHIVPHDAKPKAKQIEEGVKSVGGPQEDSDVAAPSTMITRSYCGNSSDQGGSASCGLNNAPSSGVDTEPAPVSDSGSVVDSQENHDPHKNVSSPSDVDVP